MKQLMKIVAFGSALCLGGCSNSYLSQVGQQQSMGIVTVDSLGIKLGDSKSQVKQALKSLDSCAHVEKPILTDIKAMKASALKHEMTFDTAEVFNIRTNIGTIHVTFMFDKAQKLIMYMVLYPLDCSTELARLEAQKGAFVVNSGMEMKYADFGKLQIKAMCMSADGEVVSYIYQVPWGTVIFCITGDQIRAVALRKMCSK